MPPSSKNVCVLLSSSGSSHSDPEDSSSKKSAPGDMPCSIEFPKVGCTDPLRSIDSSTIFGEEAGLDDSLAAGQLTVNGCVALGGPEDNGRSGNPACCLSEDTFVLVPSRSFEGSMSSTFRRQVITSVVEYASSSHADGAYNRSGCCAVSPSETGSQRSNRGNKE